MTVERSNKGVVIGAAILIAVVAAWTVKLHSHFGWNIICSVLVGIVAFFVTGLIGMGLGKLFGGKDQFVQDLITTLTAVAGAVCALIFL